MLATASIVYLATTCGDITLCVEQRQQSLSPTPTALMSRSLSICCASCLLAIVIMLGTSGLGIHIVSYYSLLAVLLMMRRQPLHTPYIIAAVISLVSQASRPNRSRHEKNKKIGISV